MVLILVLMEYALRYEIGSACVMWNNLVLILVLMEYALRFDDLAASIREDKGLNPCFNGICSAIFIIMATNKEGES